MKSTDSSNPAEKNLIHKQLNHSLEGKKAPAEQCSASKLLWNSLPRPGSLLPALPGENPGLYLKRPSTDPCPCHPTGPGWALRGFRGSGSSTIDVPNGSIKTTPKISLCCSAPLGALSSRASNQSQIPFAGFSLPSYPIPESLEDLLPAPGGSCGTFEGLTLRAKQNPPAGNSHPRVLYPKVSLIPKAVARNSSPRLLGI